MDWQDVMAKWHGCHCCSARRLGKLEGMKQILQRLARGTADVVAECNYAQRRLMQLQSAPDRYLSDPDVPPDNYAEFLFRTSGWLLHEPSASARARGAAHGPR
jgi:hypothetical protein